RWAAARARRQPLPARDPAPRGGFAGEVPVVARGEILEEVAALRRRHLEVGETRLDDRPRSRNLMPGDRDPEEGIRGPPPADADQEIGTLLPLEPRVELADRLRDLSRARTVEAPRVRQEDVADAVDRAVAERARALAENAVAGDRLELRLDRLADAAQRPKLQEPELGRRAAQEVHRELDLDRDARRGNRHGKE